MSGEPEPFMFQTRHHLPTLSILYMYSVLCNQLFFIFTLSFVLCTLLSVLFNHKVSCFSFSINASILRSSLGISILCGQ